ncbi:hypothetical protein BB560_002564, partial [Smittium megazygosporum]
MVFTSLSTTAVPAWYPRPGKTLLATGTVAGAMDATFSNASSLEIFEILGPSASTSSNKLIGKTLAPGRFHRLAWSPPVLNNEFGLLAGGLENGQISVWDASNILSSAKLSDTIEPIFSSNDQIGNVCGLQFNPFQANLLASGSENGLISIWDVANDFKSYSPGNRSNRIEAVTDLSWNNQVQHILATSSNSGATVVWDLRNRREVITLSYASQMGLDMNAGINSVRSGVSAVSWNPSSATQLVTSLNDDQSPVILLWDLRNANAPSKIFQGHSRGVLSLSWCNKDSGLLLSSGKDNRTICWDPNTGGIISELPQSNNWVFDVQWNQCNPNLISSASFDGKIDVYQISSKKASPQQQYVSDPFDVNANLRGSDSLVLKQPPNWLSRPCSATFGFGNKLAYFTSANKSVIITQVVSEPELANRAKEMSDKLNTQTDALCMERLNEATNAYDANEWNTLLILFQPDARERLIQTLGFDKVALSNRVRALVEKKKSEADHSNTFPKSPISNASSLLNADSTTDSTFNKPESTPFDDDGLGASDDFIQSINKDSNSITDTIAELSLSSAPTSIRFTGNFLLTQKDDEVSDLVTKSLFLGNIEDSIDLCIEYDRFDDALMLASCSGPELTQKVQKAYFEKHSNSNSYFRLLYSIYSSDLSDAVANTDVFEWRETLAFLCTYAQDVQFGLYCSQLGSRLEAAFANNNDQNLMWGALVCYLVSGNLSRIASIWIKRQQEDQSGCANFPSVSLIKTRTALQNFIEKISILSAAISYEDPALTNPSANAGLNDFPLAPLYNSYLDYAEFLVSQGLTELAVQFIAKIPANYHLYNLSGEDHISLFKYRLYMTGIYWNNMPIPEPGFTLNPIVYVQPAPVSNMNTQQQQGYPFQNTQQYSQNQYSVNKQVPQQVQHNQYIPQQTPNALPAQSIQPMNQFNNQVPNVHNQFQPRLASQTFGNAPQFPQTFQRPASQMGPPPYRPPPVVQPAVVQPPPVQTNALNQIQNQQGANAYASNQMLNQQQPIGGGMVASVPAANPIIPQPRPVSFDQPSAPPSVPNKDAPAWNDPPMLKNPKSAVNPGAPKTNPIPAPFPNSSVTPPTTLGQGFAEQPNMMQPRVPPPPPNAAMFRSRPMSPLPQSRNVGHANHPVAGDNFYAPQ